MGQKHSRSITNEQTNEQTSGDITVIPQDLLKPIMSFLDPRSQLEFANTCTTLYHYHKLEYIEKGVSWLHSPSNYDYSYPRHRKALERWLSKPGWTTEKVTAEGASTNYPTRSKYPIRALCLDHLLMNDELKQENIDDYFKRENIDAYIIDSSERLFPVRNISFLKKFPNLQIVGLFDIKINKKTANVLSKLSLLRTISIKHCEVTNDALSKIFETCTTLRVIELHFNEHVTSLVLPPQAEEIQIKGTRQYMGIDLSRCTQLRSLVIEGRFFYADVVPPKIACLWILQLLCFLIKPDCFGDSLLNLRTLIVLHEPIQSCQSIRSSIPDGNPGKRRLDLSALKCLSRLEFFINTSVEFGLSCIFPSGDGHVNVKFIELGEGPKGINYKKIKLDSKATKKVALNQYF